MKFKFEIACKMNNWMDHGSWLAATDVLVNFC